MSMEHYIRAIAGSIILLSLLLGYLYSPYWYLFTAFVGVNLLQSAFTKWCLMEEHFAQIGRAQGQLILHRGRKNRLIPAPPPSEPDLRISRIRLSSWWFYLKRIDRMIHTGC